MMLTNGLAVGLINALMVSGWVSFAAGGDDSAVQSEATPATPVLLQADDTAPATESVETLAEEPEGNASDTNSGDTNSGDTHADEPTAETKPDESKRSPVSRSVARVNSVNGNVEVLVETEVETELPAGSSAVADFSTVTGKLVIVGPDGTKREFDLKDQLPEGVRVFAGEDLRKNGTFRIGTGAFRGKDPKAVQSEQKSIIVFSEGRAEPVDILKETAPEKRLMIGVHCVEADELLRGHLKLDGRGLVVVDVVPDTPAAAAGFQKNDLLLQAGDSDLKTVQDLLSVVQQAGENEVSFSILRRGDPSTLKVTPKLMDSPRELIITLSGDEQPRHIGGMGVWWQKGDGIPDQLRQELELRRGQLKLRQIPPGIVIDKSSSVEEIERLVKEAMSAAREASELAEASEKAAAVQQALAAHQGAMAASPQTDAELHEQIREMKEQLKSVLDRVGKLEKQE